MTEREKIIELARDCGLVGYYLKQDDFIIAFYKAVQADAFEQAAQLVDDMEVIDGLYGPKILSAIEDTSDAIRQLGKEKK